MKRCTMCGEKLNTMDEYGNFSFQHRVGYGSKYDGDMICLTLCCDCFDRVVGILSMMSKEKIIFSPEELSENCGCQKKWILLSRKRCRIKQQAQKRLLRFTSAGNADRKCGG